MTRSRRLITSTLATLSAITMAMGGVLGLAAPAHASGGTVWTLRSAPNVFWGGVTYGTGRFVAVGTNSVLTSSDGVTWTSGTGIPTGAWTSLTYSGGQFVAVAANASNLAMTSPDGITWTPQPGLNVPTNWNSVAYGNGKYVASGDMWMAYSPDGIAWTEINTDPSIYHSWSSVTFADDTFVAVNSSSGATNRVMTSNDGITWTPRNTGIEANEWKAVTYGAGLFVAVAGSGTNRVMTSPDGVNWTPRSAASPAYWRSVTYGGGQFLAVGHSGGVMTSPEGTTWTSQTSGTTGVWRSVTAGPQYVAVGQTSGEPVMSSFISPAPAITSVDPVSGPVAGGGVITINGAGFLAGAVVEVGGSPCTSVSVTSATRLTCTLPAGSAGSVSVSVTNSDSQSAISAAAYTYVAPPPPPPVAADPPRDASASAGDRSATVAWLAPETSGSFPISHYLVTSSPGGRTCLTASLSCTVAGLTNGTAYTFTVQALNGAGWSVPSAPSNAVTPAAELKPSIVITGSRDGDRIAVTGTTKGFGMGAELTPWIRPAGKPAFTQGVATILVGVDGTFEWGRRVGKQISVYVATPDGSLRSNTVTIR